MDLIISKAYEQKSGYRMHVTGFVVSFQPAHEKVELLWVHDRKHIDQLQHGLVRQFECLGMKEITERGRDYRAWSMTSTDLLAIIE